MDLTLSSIESPTQALLQPADIIAELRMAFDEQNGEMEASDGQEFFKKLSRISAVPFSPPILEDVENVSSWGTLYAMDGEALLLALLATPSLPETSNLSEETASTPAPTMEATHRSSTSNATPKLQTPNNTSSSLKCDQIPLRSSLEEHVTKESVALDPIPPRALKILEDALDEAGGQLEPIELLDVFRRVGAAYDSCDQQTRYLVPTIEHLEDFATWGSIHAIDCQDLLRAAY